MFSYRGEMPVERVVCQDYNGLEFREEDRVCTNGSGAEPGYLSVLKGQRVWVWLNTLTVGHMGNRKEEYVYGATTHEDAAIFGWLPNYFYIFGKGQKLARAYNSGPLWVTDYRPTATLPGVTIMVPRSLSMLVLEPETETTEPHSESTMPDIPVTAVATEPYSESTMPDIPVTWVEAFTETFNR
jgi:hypothetical protein